MEAEQFCVVCNWYVDFTLWSMIAGAIGALAATAGASSDFWTGGSSDDDIPQTYRGPYADSVGNWWLPYTDSQGNTFWTPYRDSQGYPYWPGISPIPEDRTVYSDKYKHPTRVDDEGRIVQPPMPPWGSFVPPNVAMDSTGGDFDNDIWSLREY